MRFGRYVTLVLIAAAAACGSLSESPAAPELAPGELLRYLDGDPPPPPVDTELTANYDGASGTVVSRYFANNPEKVFWLNFETTDDIAASPDARLMYNVQTARTTGIGTLTFVTSGKVLDLSRVTLVVTEGSVTGNCGLNPDGGPICFIGPSRGGTTTDPSK